MKQIIYTNKAPEPVGPYSQAILCGNTLYCSGQIAINPEKNELVSGTIEEETKQVLKNIEMVLTQAGFSFENVVKTTCFLDDMKNFGTFNEIYAQYFTSKPARSCIQAILPKGARVEVEVIAVK